ncbi:MAG TPA: DUF3558 domain-containing protein [Pseudonocardiaceae bacterium]|jgi:hypothetical protein
MIAGGTVRFKFIAAVIAGGVVLTGLAGCNSGPTVGSSSSNPVPPTSTTSTAPNTQIANPLDASKYAANTCSGLTDAQVAPYMGQVDSRQSQQDSTGPVCAIVPADTMRASMSSGLLNIQTPTQDAIYDGAELFPFRQKISPIAGYPAIDESTEKTSQQGTCATVVVVNDKQAVRVQFSASANSDPNYAKPCTASETLVGQLIQNIQAGSA